jgi:hypothetical protein
MTVACSAPANRLASTDNRAQEVPNGRRGHKEDERNSGRAGADSLVIWTTYGSLIAKKLAPTIPIVFLAGAAPVEVGLITNLAHPDGHISGVTAEATSETYAKKAADPN